MADLAEKFSDLKFNDFTFAEKKPGKEGYRHKVKANFTDIKIEKSTIIFQYNVEVEIPEREPDQKSGDKNPTPLPPRPGVPERKLKKQRRIIQGSNFDIFKEFYAQNKTTVFKLEDGTPMTEPVFDGRKIFYTRHPIQLNGTDGKRGSYEVKVKVPEKKFKQRFVIHVFTPPDAHRLDLSSLTVQRNLRSAEGLLQALDLIISYGAKHHNLVLNQKMFVRKRDLMTLTPQQRAKIRFPLGELKDGSFGHHQSAKLTEAGVQLNVDRTATVFYRGGRLIDLIGEYLTEKRFPQRGGGFQRGGFQRGGGNQRGGRNGGNGGPPQQQQQERVVVDNNLRLNNDERRFLNQELKGLAFELDHISYRPKNLIHCLTDRPVSQLRFSEQSREGGEARQWSVMEYYNTKYAGYFERLGRQVYGNLPAVQVGSDARPAYYPLEVVCMIEDQYYTRKLTPKLQPTMTRICGEQEPQVRFEENEAQIRNLIASSRRCETDFLRAYGLSLVEKFVQVDARLLDLPRLNGPGDKPKRLENGAWKDTDFIIPAKIPSNFQWMVVNFNREYGRDIFRAPNREQVNGLIDNLLGAARRSGLNLSRPNFVKYDELYRDPNDLKDAFHDYVIDYPNLSLILFLIPANDELYNNIKFISELEMGIVTQCVAHAKVMKFSDRTYGQNLMLKINSKLGGINAQLDKGCKVGHLKKKTMIMGLDVTHPSKFDRLGNSIASVVATYDSKMVNYYSKCVVQPNPRLEIVELGPITRELLDNFKKVNNFYPDYILVYRDGVSEGQYAEVAKDEILYMKKAFAQISRETKTKYEPKVTFIVVQKRHHTRFLPVELKDRNNKGNPKPGMVVDNSIVSNYYHDFYLSAHYGALGTTRPTRYTVLYDDSEFSGDDIQKTTYYLSHLFPRCSKVVSVPPPVLYSHLGAKRARSYLQILDNNRGQLFGERELNPEERANINQRIAVRPNLQNTLYFV